MTAADHPFADAPATEEDLERIRLEISATRRRREQAVADFEIFLREGRTGLEGRRVSPDGVVADGSMRAVDAPSLWQADDAASMPPVTLEASEGREEAPHPRIDFGVFDETDGLVERRVGPARTPPRGVWLGLAWGTAVLVLAVFGYTWVRSRADIDASPAHGDPSAAASVAASAGALPPPPVGEASPDAPVRVRAVNVELVTVAAVWMRVHVDGERVLEREMPAGQRLRYAADREIVLRAGNAGALKVVAGDGAEQMLGRAGEVVTRTFTATAR